MEEAEESNSAEDTNITGTPGVLQTALKESRLKSEEPEALRGKNDDLKHSNISDGGMKEEEGA